MAFELCCVLNDLKVARAVVNVVSQYYFSETGQNADDELVQVFNDACVAGNLERLTLLWRNTQLFQGSPPLCYLGTLLATNSLETIKHLLSLGLQFRNVVGQRRWDWLHGLSNRGAGPSLRYLFDNKQMDVPWLEFKAVVADTNRLHNHIADVARAQDLKLFKAALEYSTTQLFPNANQLINLIVAIMKAGDLELLKVVIDYSTAQLFLGTKKFCMLRVISYDLVEIYNYLIDQWQLEATEHLEAACRAGSYRLVRHLLASTPSESQKTGRKLIHSAMARRYEPLPIRTTKRALVIQLLISHYRVQVPDLDPHFISLQCRDNNVAVFQTFFSLGWQISDAKILELLLDAGRGGQNKMVIFLAQRVSPDAMAEFLATRGSELNAQTRRAIDLGITSGELPMDS